MPSHLFQFFLLEQKEPKIQDFLKYFYISKPKLSPPTRLEECLFILQPVERVIIFAMNSFGALLA